MTKKSKAEKGYFGGRGEVVILYSVVTDSLTEYCRYTVDVMGWDCAWHIGGKTKKPMWLEWNENYEIRAEK